MLDVDPLISLPLFIIGFIVVLMTAALFADIYVSRQEKARGIGSSNPAGKRRHLSPSQKVIQRYYNQKGA